jgi:hypothetical protein
MALLDDIINQQRTQYPYYLPPTPQQEALQPSNILGDLVQRWAPAYSNFVFGPGLGPHVTNVLAGVMPMIAGMAQPIEAETAAPEIAARLGGATEALGGLTERIRPAPETGPLPKPAQTGTFPAATYEHTAPLPELEARGQMYHGTPEPILKMVTEGMVSSPANAAGPGFYSAGNVIPAETSYANVFGRAGEPGTGHVYDVFQIRDVPFFDAQHQSIPPDVLAAVKRRVPDFKAEDFEHTPGIAAYRSHLVRREENLAIKQALTDELKKKGYRGLKYQDIIGTGADFPYETRVYWNPEDVRVRETFQRGMSRDIRPGVRYPAPTIEQSRFPYSRLPNPRPILPNRLALPPPAGY